MEDTITYCAAKKDAVPVFQNSTSWVMILFRFFQQLYLEEEAHSNTFKLLSPEERYQYVLEHKPNYLQRIPLVHLASYLGMSRETLTRIRKKIS
jgi:CRP-like cAMP-binding protein